MNIHDVSDSSQFKQLLGRQKAILQSAKARQGERPKDRKTPEGLVEEFMKHYEMSQLRHFDTSNRMNLSTSFVAPPYPPSTACFEELEQTFIKNLQLENHHGGVYVLVRSITPPNEMTAIMAIVEDEKSDAIMLQLYQQDTSKTRLSESVIKQHDVFIVKEPYFKVMADGEYGLRVDHVSDLVRVEAWDKRFPKQWPHRDVDAEKTAHDLKLEGNYAMKKQQYWIAIRCYTAALRREISPQDRDVLLLNRALAHLKDENFDAALVDTRSLNQHSLCSEKALYRAGQALYNLGRFSECQDALKLLCENFPQNLEAAKELTRVRCRLEEQQSGAYDFRTIYEQASNLRPPHLDHATFIGSAVIKASAGRGRGLFTAKAVKAGELILCEKAFAHCYADVGEKSAQNTSTVSLLVNIHTGRMAMGTQSDLITVIVQKLSRNSSLLSRFMELYHGSYEPVSATEVDENPIIDTFLVENIISLNSFGCPLSSRDSYFGAANTDKDQHHSCGIWLIASSINHSCVSNVRRSFIGDLQLVHATRDLPANTELTFWYHIPNGSSYEKTQQNLQVWGFKCDCVVCVEDKNTAKKLLKRRDTLLEDFKAIVRAGSEMDIAKAERLLAAIDQTYKSPASKIPRLGLWDPYILLTRTYVTQKQPDKVISSALKVLECSGFVIKGAHMPASINVTFEIKQWGVMVQGVIEAWIHLCNAYKVLAPHLSLKAKECAKIAYRICIGEDTTFDDTWEKIHS